MTECSGAGAYLAIDSGNQTRRGRPPFPNQAIGLDLLPLSMGGRVACSVQGLEPDPRETNGAQNPGQICGCAMAGWALLPSLLTKPIIHASGTQHSTAGRPDPQGYFWTSRMYGKKERSSPNRKPQLELWLVDQIIYKDILHAKQKCHRQVQFSLSITQMPASLGTHAPVRFRCVHLHMSLRNRIT